MLGELLQSLHRTSREKLEPPRKPIDKPSTAETQHRKKRKGKNKISKTSRKKNR